MSKTYILAALSVIGFCLHTARASAGIMNGGELLSHCANRDALCLGFVVGVANGLEVASATEGARPQVCLPEDVQGWQLIDVVIRGLLGELDDRRHDAGPMVALYLEDEWPCALS